MSIKLVDFTKGWDFQNRHVQPNIDTGAFISGKSVLLLSGPSRVEELVASAEGSNAIGTNIGSSNSMNMLYPIGVVQQFQFSSASPRQEIHEIGSDRPYFIRARTAYSASIGHVFYNGPNLLRALYAYAPFEYKGGNKEAFKPIIPIQSNGYRNVESLKNKSFTELPGTTDHWLNLASDLFDYPFGLVVIFADTTQDVISAHYLEDCFINGSGLSVGATSSIIMESASLRFARIVPIKLSVKLKESLTDETNDQPSVVEG